MKKFFQTKIEQMAETSVSAICSIFCFFNLHISHAAHVVIPTAWHLLHLFGVWLLGFHVAETVGYRYAEPAPSMGILGVTVETIIAGNGLPSA